MATHCAALHITLRHRGYHHSQSAQFVSSCDIRKKELVMRIIIYVIIVVLVVSIVILTVLNCIV